MDTEAAGVRVRGATSPFDGVTLGLGGAQTVWEGVAGVPVVEVGAQSATSPLNGVTVCLGGARSSCEAVVRISATTIWLVVGLGGVGSGLAGADAVGLLGATFADLVQTGSTGMSSGAGPLCAVQMGSTATSLGLRLTGPDRGRVEIGWLGLRGAVCNGTEANGLVVLCRPVEPCGFMPRHRVQHGVGCR